MWIYEKRLQFPVKITKPNPALALAIITQYGGPDGELGASIRYLSQRFTMVTPQARAVLNDIGTEELGHLEMIGTIVHQLTKGASPEELKRGGFDPYYADHGIGIFPQSSGGSPFTAAEIQSTGDPIADLYENMAAEQKARATYEYLLEISDCEEVKKPLRFLREREIVHFQRFGECLQIVKDYMGR